MSKPSRNGDFGRDDPIRISKEMSKVLRHHPPPGAMDAAGWVEIPVLLKHLRCKPTEAQVRQVRSQAPCTERERLRLR